MPTRIVCHRGACREAPENTIASARLARRLGGDIVELDVRQSRDGVLYVLHDATVDRTTDGSGAIAQLSARTLDELDAGAWFAAEFTAEPLPRLDTFFKAVSHELDFYVEVKDADPDAVAAAIRAAGLEQRCFTYSEEASMRNAMAVAAPWLKRMLNWCDIDSLDEVRERGAAIIEFHSPDMTAERVKAAHAMGLEVMMHTPDHDEAAFRRALQCSVDYLNIDYPAAAKRLRNSP